MAAENIEKFHDYIKVKKLSDSTDFFKGHYTSETIKRVHSSILFRCNIFLKFKPVTTSKDFGFVKARRIYQI